KKIPFAAVTFVLAGMASMGLPGFSGFIAEFQVVIGAWKAFPTLAVITGAGIVIGVAYTLNAMQRAFFGEAEPEAASEHAAPLEPISFPERLGAILLLGTSLVVGLFPGILLDMIQKSFTSPLFIW